MLIRYMDKIFNYIDSIETIVETFQTYQDSNNSSTTDIKINLDTSQINAIGKLYLVIYTDKIMDITKYFNSIVCEFNGVKTELTSDFASLILKLHTDITFSDGLDKMLSNSPIYLPIKLFSIPIYVKNQNISISLTGVSYCEKIELVYDKINLVSTFDVNKFYPNSTMKLEVFEIHKFNGIKERLSISLTNNLQNMFWIYKENKYIHPVKAIGLEGKYGSQHIVIRKLNDSIYYTLVQQKVNYTSLNEDIYTYSFILNPEQFDNFQGVLKYLETIEIIQEIKPEYIEEKNNLTQIVCLKCFCDVNLII